ncbi:hypothetical protein EC919_11750 [Pseudomonas graminis]|nr:hypothetical protein EC919_11750 [Pseudomonas graminis]
MDNTTFAARRLTLSRLKPVPQGMRHEPIPWVYAVFSGTGFSREGARMDNTTFAARRLTLSRLKPVPQGMRHEPIPWVYAVFSGTGFSREEARMDNTTFAARHPTLSRLKPVLRDDRSLPREYAGPKNREHLHGWLSRPKVYIEFKIQ